ncbi:ATP-dependent DNA helicase Q-like 4A [Linum perenne]
MAAKDKFIWRVENFSTLTEAEIHSPSFSLKGHQWKIRFHPKGDICCEFIRPILEFADSEAEIGDGGIMSLLPYFRLTMINQLSPKSSIETTFKLKQDYGQIGSWVYRATVFYEKISNLAPQGFLVNDTLIFEARIHKSLKDTLHAKLLMLRTVLNEESGARSDSEHILGDVTLEYISENIPRTKETLQEVCDLGKKEFAKYVDRLLQTIESTISDYNAEEGSESKGDEKSDFAKRKRETATIEPSEASYYAKRMRESATAEPSEAIDSTKNMVAKTSTTMIPCSSNVRSALKNMIAELSTVASSWKSTAVADVQMATNDANHGSALLEEQRGKLYEFYDMSLEAICRANLFDSVHEVVLRISELTNDPFEKRVLKDLLSQLVEFKSSIPESVSIIESFPMVESSNVQIKKQIEGILTERQNQLMFLDSDVSRIEEDELKVDAEIQQLLARKDKLVHEKKLALADMEAATREASRELGELKRKHTKYEQARSDLLRAKERLAHYNASWKLFKENSAL